MPWPSSYPAVRDISSHATAQSNTCHPVATLEAMATDTLNVGPCDDFLEEDVEEWGEKSWVPGNEEEYCTFEVLVFELGVSTSAGLHPERRKWNKDRHYVSLMVNAGLLMRVSPQRFPDTPAVHISASTSLASPEPAHVLHAACLFLSQQTLWRHQHRNQKCMSVCSLFTSDSHNVRKRLRLILPRKFWAKTKKLLVCRHSDWWPIWNIRQPKLLLHIPIY